MVISGIQVVMSGIQVVISGIQVVMSGIQVVMSGIQVALGDGRCVEHSVVRAPVLSMMMAKASTYAASLLAKTDGFWEQ